MNWQNLPNLRDLRQQAASSPAAASPAKPPEGGDEFLKKLQEENRELEKQLVLKHSLKPPSDPVSSPPQPASIPVSKIYA